MLDRGQQENSYLQHHPEGGMNPWVFVSVVGCILLTFLTLAALGIRCLIVH